MRELINILNESIGLANRKPGEVFINDRGREIRFQQVDFYPQEGGQYEDEKQMQDAINQISWDIGVAPTYINEYNPKYKAFGFAQFIDQRGHPTAFVKFFTSVKADPRANAWDNQTGIPGYKYRGKAAVKTQSSATPQDILVRLDDLTAQDIVKQIAAKFPNSSLVTVAQHLAQGGELPFTFDAPADMPIAAFQDYFCELLHPIALQTGQFTGEAGDAAQVFLPETGFQDTLISFGKNKTEGLSDSIMTASDGRRLKVSSKGGSGAAASSKNILDSYKELEQSPKNRKLLKSVQDTTALINTIVSTGQHVAPLLLGVRYDIISHEDLYFIKGIRGLAPRPLDVLKDVTVEGSSPSKNLIKLAADRGTKTPEQVNFYYHLMAAVAHKVANHVNNNTSFGKDAALILNHSALIQVYSTVKATGDKWTLQKFSTKWPGSLVSGVSLDAGKNYMSTQIKGNFTFTINPGASKQTAATADEPQVIAAKPKAPGKTLGVDDIGTPRKKRSTNQGLGRERR